MAKKDVKNGNGASGFRFINVELNSSDKTWLRSNDLPKVFPIEMAFDLVGEGYRFSLSYDEKNSSFIASLTDKRLGGKFTSCCLSGRGRTAITSWYSLAYRHFFLAEGDWAVLDSGAGEPDDFG